MAAARGLRHRHPLADRVGDDPLGVLAPFDLSGCAPFQPYRHPAQAESRCLNAIAIVTGSSLAKQRLGGRGAGSIAIQR